MEARSIAVVGASERPDSFGRHLLEQLVSGGFDGDIVPVNPRYRTILGRACVESLADLDEPVDLVALGVPNHALERELTSAAGIGARAAVIFASCYEEAPPGSPTLSERLTKIADDAGIAVCGGNCMGFLNMARGLRVCGFPMPAELRSGGITFISHSGSAFSALAHNDRGLGFNLIVSTGQEFNTSAAAYMLHALQQPETQVIALFLETVREPSAFRRALHLAQERDVPVVALKVGRAQRAQALVAAHSGALAGEDGAYEAVFRTHGVLRVSSLDEMGDLLELLASRRRAGPGGLAAIHDSGGERALLVDSAEDVGVRFADISPRTVERLDAVLEEGLPPVNPLDAWGTGNDYEPIYESCMDALLEDPDTAALAFSVDLTTQETPETGYIRVAKKVYARTDKPMAILSNFSAAVDRRDVASLRAEGIPVLESTYSGLAAFKHLFELRDARALPPVVAAPRVDPGTVQRWRARLAEPGGWDELRTLELLADYGIPTVRAISAGDKDAVLEAAAALGGPVVVKTASPGITHKSDARGVALGLEDPAAIARAYDDIAARLGPRVVVQQMAPPGIEVAMGAVRDAQFGPLVMVAAGGLLIELLRDRRWALPPLDRRRARGLIDSLSVGALLKGFRALPAADIDALSDVLVRVGQVACDVGDLIDALDVNPLLAGPEGCVAVDAHLVPRAAAPDS